MKPINLTTKLLLDMRLPQPEGGSKDGRGCVLVVGGSVEVPGAALLAAPRRFEPGPGNFSSRP